MYVDLIYFRIVDKLAMKFRFHVPYKKDITHEALNYEMRCYLHTD